MDQVEKAIEEYENKTTEDFLTMFEKLGLIKAMEVCERVLIRFNTTLAKTDPEFISDADMKRFYDLFDGFKETLSDTETELNDLDLWSCFHTV